MVYHIFIKSMHNLNLRRSYGKSPCKCRSVYHYHRISVKSRTQPVTHNTSNKRILLHFNNIRIWIISSDFFRNFPDSFFTVFTLVIRGIFIIIKQKNIVFIIGHQLDSIFRFHIHRQFFFFFNHPSIYLQIR